MGWFVAFFFAIKWYGIVWGLLGVVVIWQAYIRVMKHFFGLEHLSGMDAFWFHDDETNVANIIAFMRFQSFETEEFRAQIFRKLIAFDRNRA